MARILVIDDSLDIQVMVKALLEADHTLVPAMTLKDAKSILLEQKSFDLILLDVDLPDGNGIEFLGQGLAQGPEGETPVILLTSYDSVNTRVMSYTFGAEDFIAKPFDPTEFQVRLSARLKRLSKAKHQQVQTSNLRFGQLELDLETQRAAKRDLNNKSKEIELTPVEFKMLYLFVKEKGAVVARDQILTHVWGGHVHVSPRVVDHHVSAVRKKIEGTGAKIEAVYGVGYKLEAA